ncbi:MAG: hypothetical protein EOP48_12605 [Sphingobacteriales bacterium]|nr:MAG: hypothetical protein EOP48_12605 [Sphingobacteriales bacterium]
MALNYEQIKQQEILTDIAEENYNNAVYDIRAGKILTLKGKEVDEYEIPPQGMVVVVSMEHLTMPSDTIGYAHVRTSLSSKGIMAINIGIIDPGYSGKLASTLLNFGKEPYPIKAGDIFLRTTFHQLNPVTNDKLSVVKTEKSMDDKTYLTNKKFESLKYMDETFMSFDKEVKKSMTKVFDNLLKYAGGFSASLALLTFTINFIVGKLNTDPADGYEYQLKINQSKYELLESQFRSLQVKIDSITELKHIESGQPSADSTKTENASHTRVTGKTQVQTNKPR